MKRIRLICMMAVLGKKELEEKKAETTEFEEVK